MAKAADDDESPELQKLLESVGSRIREIRLQRKMTQKDLAILSDVRATYLNEIELLGVNVSLKLLLQIAQALNVLPRDLLPERASDDSVGLVRQKASELTEALGSFLKALDEPTSPSKLEAKLTERPDKGNGSS